MKLPTATIKPTAMLYPLVFVMLAVKLEPAEVTWEDEVGRPNMQQDDQLICRTDAHAHAVGLVPGPVGWESLNNKLAVALLRGTRTPWGVESRGACVKGSSSVLWNEIGR